MQMSEKMAATARKWHEHSSQLRPAELNAHTPNLRKGHRVFERDIYPAALGYRPPHAPMQRQEHAMAVASASRPQKLRGRRALQKEISGTR
jgi:hypothetical protein